MGSGCSDSNAVKSVLSHSTLKGKKLFPLGANLYFLEHTPFQTGPDLKAS